MPLDPEANADAFRTLGLQPGASKVEIKRAYRLLAKAFHPDSAGEAALPRFLAIHEAYDRLITGRIGAGPKTTGAAQPEPWRADPARARQARERARSARGGTGRGGAGPAGRSAGPSSSTSGSSASSGSSGGGTRGTTGTRGSGRRHVRKATMGSTSYDEARDINDPTWSGASWYGPSSGEYWIVNPREYADPRKHGPEYQSRARRPLPGDAAIDDAEAPTATATGTRADAASGWPTGATGSAAEAAAGSQRWGSRPSASSWTAPASDPAGPRYGRPDRTAAARHGAGDFAGRRAAPTEAAPDRAASTAARSSATGRSWLGGPTDDPIRRLGFALVALARILAGGAFSMLVAVVPLTLLLVLIGGSSTLEAGLAPAALLAVAWLVGVAWAAFRAGAGRRPTRAGTKAGT